MSEYCLLGSIGACVALGHGEVGMSQEHLNIDLPSTGVDGPGGEGVPESMRVDVRHACAPSLTPRQDMERACARERPTAAGKE